MNYVLALCECASITVVIAGLEKGRRKTSVIKMLIYLASYLMFFTINMVCQLPPEVSFVNFLLLYIYVKWSYEEDSLHTLTLVVFGMLIVSMMEMVLMIGISGMLQLTVFGEIHKLVASCITIVFAVFIYRSKIYRVLAVVKKWDFLYVVVAILSMMMFAPVIVIKIINNFDISDYVYVVVCILVMWLLAFRMQKYKIEAKIRKQYNEGYKNVIAQIRRRQHKFENQISAAYSLLYVYDDYEELIAAQKGYLSKLEEYELPNDAIVLEEPSVIALIYEKLNEALEQGIQLETSFSCSMVESKISDVLWVEIIGTLLDNAIEALVDYEEEKKIWLNIFVNDSNQITVRIANTFHRLTAEEINGFFAPGYSSKGEERGLGLYHVYKLVDKYSGEIYAKSKVQKGLESIVFEVTI